MPHGWYELPGGNPLLLRAVAEEKHHTGRRPLPCDVVQFGAQSPGGVGVVREEAPPQSAAPSTRATTVRPSTVERRSQLSELCAEPR
ncbi:hypothetical protein ACIQ7D_05150 [Streptomyces sp. NPDC096310]|uniref:hypothetical protein n=1 Tax=Streptomyces sp. NPDC096310 TaxID=3366082 RepID=UPI00380DB1AE